VRLSVVIPVLDGADFIGDSLATLDAFLDDRLPDSEIIVADDGSSDGTRSVVSASGLDRVRLVGLERHRGKLAAVREGMAFARGDCRVYTDADLPFDLEALPYLARLVVDDGFHLAVGDRTLPDSDATPASLPRRIATRAFSFSVRMLVTGELFDTQCGLKAFRGDVADALFPLTTDGGFSGDVEILYIALKHNLAIRRIPVRLRRSAPSTVRLARHAMPMVVRILGLRRRWLMGSYRSPALAAVAAQRYWEQAS
jgi:glycosyltransferase involved in cell wall biosynthesis